VSYPCAWRKYLVQRIRGIVSSTPTNSASVDDPVDIIVSGVARDVVVVQVLLL
jgi:hypothetical protein